MHRRDLILCRPQWRRMKEKNVPTQNQTISRLRQMHRRRISRLKLIIFPQRRDNKQIIFRFKHLKRIQAIDDYSRNAESQISSVFEGLKGFLVRDFENLWHSWNVNRFCTDQHSRR